VERPDHIVVHANDLDGNALDLEATDFAARVICHETDHLNGVLFTDKVLRYIDPDAKEEEI
jgi:peptide deformylase